MGITHTVCFKIKQEKSVVDGGHALIEDGLHLF